MRKDSSESINAPILEHKLVNRKLSFCFGSCSLKLCTYHTLILARKQYLNCKNNTREMKGILCILSKNIYHITKTLKNKEKIMNDLGKLMVKWSGDATFFWLYIIKSGKYCKRVWKKNHIIKKKGQKGKRRETDRGLKRGKEDKRE